MDRGLLNTRRSKPISRGGRAGGQTDRPTDTPPSPPHHLRLPLPARPGPSAPCPPLGGRRGSGGRAGRAGPGRRRGGFKRGNAVACGRRRSRWPEAPGLGGEAAPRGGGGRGRAGKAPVGRRGWRIRLPLPSRPS